VQHVHCSSAGAPAGIRVPGTARLFEASTSTLTLRLLRIRPLPIQNNSHFKNLLEALRFANDSYYAGDIVGALRNYDALEVTMQQVKNQRGLGAVYMNKVCNLWYVEHG
jgi:hypothetical protein